MNRTSKAALMGLGLLAADLVGAFAISQAFAQEADVTLRLVNPANPGLLAVNESATEAAGIGYTIGLWNADNMQDDHKMLSIPGSGFHRLLPNSTYGPISLFDKPEVRAWLKPGNMIVGTVAIDCRNCARGRTYWVLITWGEGGWFSEIKDVTDGRVIAPEPWSTGNLRGHELKIALLGEISEVDQKDRIPIMPFTASDQTIAPQDDGPMP